MVVVEDVVNDTLNAYLRDWFEPDFKQAFMGLSIISVPDDVKPIPKCWVDEVELDVQIDGDGQDEGGLQDNMSDKSKRGSFTPQQCKVKLQEALERLGLDDTIIPAPRIGLLSRQQLFQEKHRVKQELKRFDKEFHKQADRWPTHCEKEPMRPLYIYHRQLKALIEHSEGRSKGRLSDDGSVSHLGVVWESSPRHGEVRLTIGAMAADDVKARIAALQLQKTAVRKRLQAYQEKFVAENHRKIKYHKDILPIEREYKVYKSSKDEIAKLESHLRSTTWVAA